MELSKSFDFVMFQRFWNHDTENVKISIEICKKKHTERSNNEPFSVSFADSDLNWSWELEFPTLTSTEVENNFCRLTITIIITGVIP